MVLPSASAPSVRPPDGPSAARTVREPLGIRSRARPRGAGPPLRPRLARRPRRRSRATRPRSARRARCSATSPIFSPAGLPHLARPVGPPQRRASLARRDDPEEPRAGRAAPRRRPGLTLLETIDAHGHADGRPAAAPLAALAAPRSRRRSTPGSTRWRSRCAIAAAAPRLREALDGVRDLERLAGRAAAGRATPRELGALRDSFHRLPDVRRR